MKRILMRKTNSNMNYYLMILPATHLLVDRENLGKGLVLVSVYWTE